MDIQDWVVTPDLSPLYRQIRDLGLETNLAELEAFGFTVIENALSPSLTTELRDAVLAAYNRRNGKKLDLDDEVEFQGIAYLPYLLFEDPVFKKAVMNPGPLALMTYLVGNHGVLSSLGSHIKGPSPEGLFIHSDTHNGAPVPFPAASQVASCNYMLTDYTRDNGALAMVPGSHRHLRQPLTMEELDVEGPNVFPIEVPAGSAIVWHGATWHGSYARKNPGVRMNLSVSFQRPHLLPGENYREHIPEGFLDGEDERLARLVGADLAYGWTEDGPSKAFAPQTSWHA